MKSHAVLGDYNVECMVCRKKTKASDSRKRWDGFIVCETDGCWEERHPLEQPRRVLPDERKLPFTSPESADTYRSVDLDSNRDQTGVPAGTFQTDTI